MFNDPDATIVVYTCESCTKSWFPDRTDPPRVHDADVAIVHERHIGEFLSAGFELVEHIVEGNGHPRRVLPAPLNRLRDST